MRPLVALFLGCFAWLPSALASDPTPFDEFAASMRGNVVAVWIKGNAALSHEEILRSIQTRPGTMLEFEVLKDDVRRLDGTYQFRSVQTFYRKVPGGREVIFVVSEHPRLREVKFVGNKSIRKQVIDREADLIVGDPANPCVIEDARCRIEEFYHNRGFENARVTVSGADKPGNDQAVFVIDEGTKKLARSIGQIQK
jgi:outer membrane protein insertion porin family